MSSRGVSGWLAYIREAISSRGVSEDPAGQEEDQEILDDMVFIVKILQVASEEAAIHLKLCKVTKGLSETKAEEAEITTESQEAEDTGGSTTAKAE